MKTKICTLCEQRKSLDDFAKRKNTKDGKTQRCKECVNQYSRQHYKNDKISYKERATANVSRVRSWYIDYKKTLCCEKCNEDRYFCLTFHHKNPKIKNSELSDMVYRGCSIDTMQKEIAKCQVVCYNCHAEIHHLERQAELV